MGNLKKSLVFLCLAILLVFTFNGTAFAKSNSSLIKENKTLKAQIKQLKSENSKLKKEKAKLKSTSFTITKENTKLKSEKSILLNENNAWKKIGSEKSGSIYIDGVREGAAKFLTFKGTPYVSIDQILLAVTGKKQPTLNYYNNLYIGTRPVNGQVDLTKLQYYAINTGYRTSMYFNNWNGKSSFIINGNKYLSGIGHATGDWSKESSTIDYKINNKYTTLKFKVGVDDYNSGTGKTGVVTVYGDNTKIYDSGSLETQDDAKEVSLNVKNYKKITFKFYSFYDYTRLVVASPTLIP